MSDDIQVALIRYVKTLESGLSETHSAGNRPLFVARLAAAAGIFADLNLGDLAAVRQRVAEERVAFGRSFLAGHDGAKAEEAFNELARIAAL